MAFGFPSALVMLGFVPLPNLPRFIREGIGLPRLWTELRQQIYLGNDDFILRMQLQLDKQSDLSEIPRAQHKPKAKPLRYYDSKHKDRKAAMVQAYCAGDYTMKENNQGNQGVIIKGSLYLIALDSP